MAHIRFGRPKGSMVMTVHVIEDTLLLQGHKRGEALGLDPELVFTGHFF